MDIIEELNQEQCHDHMEESEKLCDIPYTKAYIRKMCIELGVDFGIDML